MLYYTHVGTVSIAVYRKKSLVLYIFTNKYVELFFFFTYSTLRQTRYSSYFKEKWNNFVLSNQDCWRAQIADAGISDVPLY